MGLTIHYTLKMIGCSAACAEGAVARWRQLALDLPFDGVSDVRTFKRRHLETGRDILWSAEGALPEPRVSGIGSRTSLVATKAVAFTVDVAPGCETLDIGMGVDYCAPGEPKRIIDRPERSFHAFCKTQFANDPRCGGTANFLRAHLAVVALLEAIGRGPHVTVTINDEGKYSTSRYSDDYLEAARRGVPPTYVWHPATHNVDTLLRECGDYDQMLAALVVSANAVNPEGESPMLGRPDLPQLVASAKAAGRAVPPAVTALLARIAENPPPQVPLAMENV